MTLFKIINASGESFDKKYQKMKQEKIKQKVIGKTNKCNLQEDEALATIQNRY